MLGHRKKYGTRKTDKYIIFKLKPGKIEACDACAGGKSKQQNIPNKSEYKSATNKVAHIYIENATIKNQRLICDCY